MATQRTRNLKLYLSSGLSADARANLQIIDSLGAVYHIDASDSVIIRSKEDITFRANDASVGGSGAGGVVSFGSPSQHLTTVHFYATTINTQDGVIVTENKTQTITNKTINADNNTISNIVDANVKATAAIAGTKISPNFGSQNIETAGELRLKYSTFNVGFKASTATSASVIYTLPPTDGGLGQVLSTNGAGVLSWIPSGAGSQGHYNWNNSDGTSKTITHGFNSRNVIVQVMDPDNDYETIYGIRVTRPTLNTVQLQSSSAPPNMWKVLVRGVD